MRSIQFTIPCKPLSINHIYGQARTGRKYMKPEGKALMDTTAMLAKQAMRDSGMKIITDSFSLYVTYYMLPKNEMDVTNCEKALIDAMQGIVFTNDKLLGRNTAATHFNGTYYFANFSKLIVNENPRIDVMIETY